MQYENRFLIVIMGIALCVLPAAHASAGDFFGAETATVNVFDEAGPGTSLSPVREVLNEMYPEETAGGSPAPAENVQIAISENTVMMIPANNANAGEITSLPEQYSEAVNEFIKNYDFSQVHTANFPWRNPMSITDDSFDIKPPPFAYSEEDARKIAANDMADAERRIAEYRADSEKQRLDTKGERYAVQRYYGDMNFEIWNANHAESDFMKSVINGLQSALPANFKLEKGTTVIIGNGRNDIAPDTKFNAEEKILPLPSFGNVPELYSYGLIKGYGKFIWDEKLTDEQKNNFREAAVEDLKIDRGNARESFGGEFVAYLNSGSMAESMRDSPAQKLPVFDFFSTLFSSGRNDFTTNAFAWKTQEDGTQTLQRFENIPLKKEVYREKTYWVPDTESLQKRIQAR